MTQETMENPGPLAALGGIWEGDKGDDMAPSDDRGTERNLFRERMTFEPTGLVENHEQKLYGLRYSTVAFHEELGHWRWDARARQVMRCFLVPRGVAVIAGGTVEPDAKAFELFAQAGSHTYGICSNEFLDKEFKTVRYELRITIHDANSFRYDEDTQRKMEGRDKIFHHRDKNTLRRVK